MEIWSVTSRKWVKKFAISGILFGMLSLPALSFALGLGGIKLNSALSEILDAEIEMVGANEADLEGLKVSLASRNAFLRAGIDRSSAINSLRFVVKKRPNGTFYVKVTSRRPVREPFLNFLMEMNWRNGRMLREYTLLLDPPGTLRKPQSTVVQTPATQAPSEPAPEPVESPFIDVPQSKPAASKPQPAADPYTADNQLFPKRDIKEAPPASEPEPAPEPMAQAEPIAPAPEPEPIVPADVIPEPEPAAQDTASTDSGGVKDEYKDSGQVFDKPFIDDAPAAEEELFPRVTLNDYDPKTKGDLTKPGLADKEEVAEVVPQDELAPEPQADSQDVQPATGDYDYGITAKGDNVWTIAEKLRQDQSVTVYQMMMAILQSNPHAFVDGNVHRLKVGQVVRIEDPSIIDAISKDDAAQQYIQQSAAWDEYRQRVAEQAGAQPIVAGDVGQDDMASASATQADIAIEAPDGQNLSQTGTSAAADNDIAQLQTELQRLTQQADAERGKNSVLNDRLKEMEAELADMQRSLSVKNDELAALQQQISQNQTAASAPAEQVAVEPEPVSAPVPTPVPAEPELTEPAAEPSADQAAVIEEPAVVTDEPANDVPVIPDTAAVPDATTGAQSQSEALDVPVTRDGEQSQPAATETESGGVMDGIMSAVGSVISALTGGALLFIVVPVLVVVLVIGVIIMLRKRRGGDSFEESILSGGAPLEEQADAPATPSEAPSSETSSFLSDFAISGVGAIQSDDNEVDPLTEADVFMAYGRYEAAEDRLTEAVKNDPNRQELKVKLLELYNTTKNRSSFEATAEELYAGLGDEADGNPNWQKAIALGKQIAPDNPMFSNAATVSSETTEDILRSSEGDAEGPDSQVMDIGLDTGVFSSSDFSNDGPTEAPTGNEDVSLEFNLDDDDSVGVEGVSTDAFDLNLGTVDEEKPTMDANADDSSAGLDFSLDTDTGNQMDEDPTMSMTMDTSATTADTADVDDVDDENPTMSMTFEPEGLNLDDTSDTSSLDMDIGDQSMELNLDATDAADMSLNTDMDEVSTKLDLARAYIDMGDSEGARSILDEVLAEGNDTQKQEAEQLVSQIG